MKKSTVIALGAFLVLLAAVLLTREDHVNVGVPKLTLPTLEQSSITSLELPGAKLTFEAGAWSVASPGAPEKKFTADEGQVKYALTQLSELRAADFVTENTTKHAELEVDEAKGLRVKVNTAAGPALDVVVGKGAKSGGTYLRQASSNAVFTTKSTLNPALKKSVSTWRAKNIATVPLAEVAKISLAPVEGVGFTLVQDDQKAWALEGTAPADFRFDAAAAGRVAQSLTSLTAQDFADDDASLAEKHTIATLTRKDGKATAVHFGAKRPDGTVPVRVDGDAQVYLAGGYAIEQLPKHVDALRSTTLFSFAPEKVSRVTVSAGGKKTVVTRDGTGWKMVEPKVAPQFDPAQVNAFIARLQAMRAARAAPEVTAAQAGVAKASPTIELTIDGAKPQTLRYGNEVGTGQLYVQGSADALVYVVGANEKASFESGVSLFNKPPPPPQNFGQMQGLDSLPPDIRAKLEAQLRQQQPH